MKTFRSLVPALVIGGALLLGACGGGGSSSATATTAAPDAAPSGDGSSATADQGQGSGNLQDPAVQQCLADKGITLPQRGADQSPESPRPTMDPATRQALQDCGVTFGRGGQGGTGQRGGGGAFNDPAVQQCLAGKGITVPQRGADQAPERPRPTIDDATRQAIQDCRAQTGTTTTTG